jgi:hypothetical protein
MLPLLYSACPRSIMRSVAEADIPATDPSIKRDAAPERPRRLKLGGVLKRTENEVGAYFRQHSIHIVIFVREPDERFYITVFAPSGNYCYDGWWPRSPREPRKTMREAIEQALRGSLLLQDSKALSA